MPEIADVVEPTQPAVIPVAVEPTGADAARERSLELLESKLPLEQAKVLSQINNDSTIKEVFVALVPFMTYRELGDMVKILAR